MFASHRGVSFYEMMGAVTHIGLAAIGSASIAAHFGRLHGLTQGDGVGLVLFIYVLAIIVLRLAVLKKKKKNNIMTAPNVFRSPHQQHQGVNTLQERSPRYDFGEVSLFLRTLTSQYIC